MSQPLPEHAASYKSYVLSLQASQPLILHTMFRVRDMDASLRFYVEGLGMTLLDRIEFDSRRVTAAFLGFKTYSAGGILELTRAWDGDGPPLESIGSSHMAIGVVDLQASLEKLEAMGVRVKMRPVSLIEGAALCAFVVDPTGYSVELVHVGRASTH